MTWWDLPSYDFNEPTILQKLEAFGPRLRAIIDDSSNQDKNGRITGHVTPDSPESKTADQLRKSAGAGNVKRTHFKNLQHNKVFVARRNGVPFKVLGGSTNFTYRGPFKSEWSGGSGINIHHKFVVTDFSLPTAKVFTGSSNLSPSGESNNGDHLIMIEDQKVATAYAIEALRVFDHLHFRSSMQAAKKANAGTKVQKDVLKLKKTRAISGADENWFEPFYKAGSQKEKDRKIFSGRDDS